MRDPKPYSRETMHEERRRWRLEKRALIVQLMSVGVVFLAVESSLILFLFDGHASGWVLIGALGALTVAGVLWVLQSSFLASSRVAMHQLRGALGEDRTDIDHLVVTRRAGLVVIDSKYRTAETVDAHEIADGARRVSRRAEALTRSVLDTSRGQHRGRHRSRVKVDVRCVVVLWGPASRSLSEPACVEGVTVMSGADLVCWLREQDGEPIDRDVAKNLVGLLCKWRDNQRQLAEQPA